MTAPADVYVSRRATLAKSLQRPLAIFSGHPLPRNYVANTFPFRSGSHYTYFGGPPLEDAVILIHPGSDGGNGARLLRPTSTIDDRVWVGDMPSDEALAHAGGFVRSSLAAPDTLREGTGGSGGFIAPPGCWRTIDAAVKAGLTPATPDEMNAIIHLRLCKDEHELAAMRLAAEVSMDAHRAALAAARPGATEADVAAEYYAVLTSNRFRPSFNPIISIHGEILHSHGFPNELTDGSLLLIDAGGEEPGGYACDITRVAPVNGKWTAIQRHLYETVERANAAACAACRPGARFRDVHNIAARVIIEGLVAAELLTGDVETLAARRAHQLFFVHGVGHLIGLDVHDMEDFGDLAGYPEGRTRPAGFGDKFLRLDRDLAPGMCVTIEPGIYLIDALWQHDALWKPFSDVVNRPAIDALLRDRFGGIRVEHTVCVSNSSQCEILTNDLPTAADAVARLVGAA